MALGADGRTTGHRRGTLYANFDSMRHQVLFTVPKPKASMALGADGIDEGTKATQARVIP